MRDLYARAAFELMTRCRWAEAGAISAMKLVSCYPFRDDVGHDGLDPLREGTANQPVLSYRNHH